MQLFVQICMIVFLIAGVVVWALGGHFGDLLETFVGVFGGSGAKWHPGPKNVEKVIPKTKSDSHFFIFFVDLLKCSAEAFFSFY